MYDARKTDLEAIASSRGAMMVRNAQKQAVRSSKTTGLERNLKALRIASHF